MCATCGTRRDLFTLDFQNDAEYVGGCIAGGRRYLHINANGDVDPCVFIHYSNANIHDVSLLEALKSPLFMKYYESQPFNDNHLRPCPMLENPYELGRMVAESGAHGTDLVEPETPEELRCKTLPGAADWKPWPSASGTTRPTPCTPSARRARARAWRKATSSVSSV